MYAGEHDDYFNWLVEIIDDGRARGYSDLLYALYKTPFVWSIDNDGNREADGFELRRRFAYEEGEIFYPRESSSFPEFCTLLEVLVALAERIEDILYNPDYGTQIPEWFWLMIENLGLDYMQDGYFDQGNFDEIVWKFMNRTYDKNGNGSIFMTRNPDLNFKKMEIWYQMMHFIDENFEQNC